MEYREILLQSHRAAEWLYVAKVRRVEWPIVCSDRWDAWVRPVTRLGA
jgi:hypothetical protein